MNEKSKNATSEASVAKDAEAQSMRHWYCPKCGRSWYSPGIAWSCIGATCAGSPREM